MGIERKFSKEEVDSAIDLIRSANPALWSEMVGREIANQEYPSEIVDRLYPLLYHKLNIHDTIELPLLFLDIRLRIREQEKSGR